MLKHIFYCTLFTAVVLLAWSKLAAPSALAAPSVATFTVDTQLDKIDADTTDGVCSPGSCSLRAAIMQANVMPGLGATIIVPSGAYTLTRPPAGGDGPENGDLNLTTPSSGNPVISIVGAGADSTFIDADQIDRVLSVEAGRTASISGVTIRHGFAPASSNYGGGIYNKGDLTLTQVILSENKATFGGGIYNLSPGDLTLTEVTVRANEAGDIGGGIFNQDAKLSVLQSTIRGNIADTNGGGLYSSSDQGVMVIQSTLSSNLAHVDGGGIYKYGTMAVINSTISQNSANNNGGGIYNISIINMYNTTVVFNQADADADEEGGIGGGILNYSGAIFNIRQTLVAGNTQTEPQFGFDDCNGTINAYGWNLFWVVNNGCTVNTQNSTWGTLSSLADIGPLQDNGGPTFTHALLAGSNAIDSGAVAPSCLNADSTQLTSDQRGKPRPVDGDHNGGVNCDIGAFEVQENTPPIANAQTVDAGSGQTKNIDLTASDADGDALTYILVSQPAHGTLRGEPPNLGYASASAFVGNDHFTFKVNDGKTDSPAAQVTIHVTATPVTNTPPVANPQSLNAVSGQAKSIHLTASDADGDMLVYIVVTQPAHGALSGTAPNLTYTATAGFVGNDGFSFKVNDGTANSPNAAVTIQVTATPVTNTAPVANPQSVNALSGQAKSILLTGSDADGNALTYSLVTQPAHGALSGTAPNLTYTATTGFVGNDSFSFKVNDGTANSPNAAVTIVVAGTGPVVGNKVYLPATQK